MSKRNILGVKSYNDDSTLYIPNFENINNTYNINNVYTPRQFSDTNEYVTHLENLRKLKNFPNINKHLELLENSVYKNIVRKKLVKINWHSKIRETTLEEKQHLLEKMNNIERCNSVLDKPRSRNKLEKLQPRCKSSLDNPSKVNKLNKVNKVNKLEKIESRFKGSLNYKNLKKVNIKRTDIDDLRKEYKLDKLKLPKI